MLVSELEQEKIEQLTINGLQCRVSCNGSVPNIEQWRPRLAYLFLSLRNPHFTKRLINWFISVSETFFDRGIICIVDEPYFHNLAADFGTTPIPPEAVEKLEALSFEKRMKAQKCLRKEHSGKVQLAPWFLLSTYTPNWIKEEVQSAFRMKGAFYSEVIRQVMRIRNVPSDESTLERYAQFVLSELPVLLFSYYACPNGVVDFYPGENFRFYKAIERGNLANELPLVTKLVQSSHPHIYVNTRIECRTP